MKTSLKQLIKEEFQYLFLIKKTERVWHIPLLASLCTGIPLLVGLYFNNLQSGILACIAGLVILYLPSKLTLSSRMLTLLVCSFGFLISFTIGICFSFNPYVSLIVLGLFSVAVHWVCLYFKVPAPGSFFFIFVAAMASCMPFNLQVIPQKIGLIGLGAMFACLLAFCYTLLISRKQLFNNEISVVVVQKTTDTDFLEAFTVGLFVSISVLVAHLFKMQNPYWVPVSCLAVMQGASLRHIWRRSLHRMLGTFIGLGVCWLILLGSNSNSLTVCLSIIALQFIIEMLIVRHYALAVIFITPMTILLAETVNPMYYTTYTLIHIRFWDIMLGSALGAVGGWVMHYEKIRFYGLKIIQNASVLINKRG